MPRPESEEVASRPSPGRLRRWLLLYPPARRRAWLPRLAFYSLAFFLVPLLCVAALGAYVGPDRALGGVPAVLLLVALTSFVRSRALRAEAILEQGAASSAVGHRLVDEWPFPLEAPPRRRPLVSYAASAAGTGLIVVGFLGGGFIANGVLWPILLVAGVTLEALVTPSPVVLVALGLLAIAIGGAMSLWGLGTGPRLRDLGRQLRARDARRLVQRRGEMPVLLLRSFDDERMRDPRPVSFMQRRYEESLCDALDRLGPPITVGRPGERLGFGGAARLYVSHGHWRKAVRYLMQHSAAVVIIVGHTEGLWWEIETALREVPRERLLLFFPFVDKRPPTSSWWDGYKDFLSAWNLSPARYRAAQREHRERYRSFRERCGGTLGDALPEQLEDTFFLDFLPDGTVRMLRSKRRLPSNLMLDVVPRHRRLRFDIAPTLWPFLAKLYGPPA